MPSVSFYTDDETEERLEKLAALEKRSRSNYLTLLVNRAWEETALGTALSPAPAQQGESKKPYETPELIELDGKPDGCGL